MCLTVGGSLSADRQQALLQAFLTDDGHKIYPKQALVTLPALVLWWSRGVTGWLTNLGTKDAQSQRELLKRRLHWSHDGPNLCLCPFPFVYRLMLLFQIVHFNRNLSASAITCDMLWDSEVWVDFSQRSLLACYWTTAASKITCDIIFLNSEMYALVLYAVCEQFCL